MKKELRKILELHQNCVNGIKHKGTNEHYNRDHATQYEREQILTHQSEQQQP